MIVGAGRAALRRVSLIAPDRYTRLLAHRARVVARISELEYALDVVDRKTAIEQTAFDERGMP